MGNSDFKILKNQNNEQRREVIFFGSLNDRCFDLTYKLYYYKIKHNFVLYDYEPVLDISEIRIVTGYENISRYLDSFAYVLDIFEYD